MTKGELVYPAGEKMAVIDDIDTEPIHYRYTIFAVEWFTVRERTLQRHGCEKTVISDDVLKLCYDSFGLYLHPLI